MVVTIETTAPKRRSRKTPFWSTLDTLIFLLFSNLCCLGSCAAVATLKQMLANNCYETFDRSVFFDLGPRTTALFISQSPAHHRVNRDARSRGRERGLSKLSGEDVLSVHVYTSRSDRLLFRLAALRPSEGPQRSALVAPNDLYGNLAGIYTRAITRAAPGCMHASSGADGALHRSCSQLTHVTKKFRANGLCRAKDLARTSILWSFCIGKQELVSL